MQKEIKNKSMESISTKWTIDIQKIRVNIKNQLYLDGEVYTPWVYDITIEQYEKIKIFL